MRTPLIPELGRQTQAVSKFKASLVTEQVLGYREDYTEKLYLKKVIQSINKNTLKVVADDKEFSQENLVLEKMTGVCWQNGIRLR